MKKKDLVAVTTTLEKGKRQQDSLSLRISVNTTNFKDCLPSKWASVPSRHLKDDTVLEFCTLAISKGMRIRKGFWGRDSQGVIKWKS